MMSLYKYKQPFLVLRPASKTVSGFIKKLKPI